MTAANVATPFAGRLRGKAAVITGAGSGIGRATAVLFARHGARVLCVDIVREAAEKTATEAQASAADGGAAIAFGADCASEPDVAAAVAECVSHFGALDVFVANAGVGGTARDLLDTSEEQVMRTLRINVVGPFLAVKHAGHAMRARGAGSIIVTGSMAGERAAAGPADYSVSKAAANHIARIGAHELSGTGVRVNSIAPGMVRTEGMAAGIFASHEQQGVDMYHNLVSPARRVAAPHEISAVALFLASDDASFVNGEILRVDGGFSAMYGVPAGKKFSFSLPSGDGANSARQTFARPADGANLARL